MTVLLIAAGAALGGPARYLTDRHLRARFATPFPLGTFVVNVVGSFVLGLVAATSLDSAVSASIGTGFCGALSTYSTFGYETLRAAEEGHSRVAVLNVALSVAGSLGAAAFGWTVGCSI